MLEAAKSRGYYLIVSIYSYSNFKELKGKDRPFNNQENRKAFLESIRFVDEVVVFESAQHLEDMVLSMGISEIVVGEEYKDREVVGSIHTTVFFFPRIGDHATSKILSR